MPQSRAPAPRRLVNVQHELPPLPYNDSRPTPYDPAQLLASLTPTSPAPGPFPPPFYFDPDIAAKERDQIFSRTWQVVGHRDQVAQSWGLLHHPSGRRASAHRSRRRSAAARLLQRLPSSRRTAGRRLWIAQTLSLRLPRMDLQPRWLPQPRHRDRRSRRLQPEDFALVPVRCEEWFNLVFVNLDPDAHPLLREPGRSRPASRTLPISHDEAL